MVEGATLNVVETAIHLDCNDFYLGGGQTIWGMIWEGTKKVGHNG